MYAHQTDSCSITSSLKKSTVDDVEGAFPRTILNFLKDNWFRFSKKKGSKVFAAFHEALWLSRQTTLKMDPDTGVFGKRIRSRNSQTELLLASFKNIIAQFKFTPFFPESVKGNFQLIPINLCNEEPKDIIYGLTNSFYLNVEGNNPIEFSFYLGDGRSLRDLQRMTEENADIRALKDIFGYLEDTSYNLFPLIPFYEIYPHEDHISLNVKKTLLNETYRLKIIIKGIQPSPPTETFKVKASENPLVFSYFVLDEVKNHLDKGDKGCELLQEIAQKNQTWYDRMQLRMRTFTKDKIISMPSHYKQYWNTRKKELKIIEILVPRFEIDVPVTGSSLKIDINFTVETKDTYYRPKPFQLNDIFTNECLKYIHSLQNAKSIEGFVGEKIMSLLNMLEISYRSLSFLIMDNMVLAGAFTYLTYFGRDTVFTHLLLKPFLQTFVQQKIVQQLLNRSHKEGEAAHEIDSRILKEKEAHYDYRMTDTDFLMAVSVFELLNELNKEDLFTFLTHKDNENRYNVNSQNHDALINNAIIIFRNLKRLFTLIEQNDLIPLKRTNDPSSANWRDAINSFSRGTYPYDVNAVWIPHMFHLLATFRNDTEKTNILLKVLAGIKPSYPEEEFEQIERYFNYENGEFEEKIKSWTKKTKKQFIIDYSLEEWRTRLKNFFNDPQNQDINIQDLKKMKIGYYLREHGQGKVWFTAEDFLEDRKWEDNMRFHLEHLHGKFFLPDGNPFPDRIRTYTMALDRNKTPIPILHSDLGFMAFTKSLRGEHIERELILPTELPISLGGLAIIDKNGESLGFSVANPMLSNKNGYELNLTPREQKKEINPKTLSPWNLIGKYAYHGWGAVWEVMIDFMVAALQDSDIQSQDYQKKFYWWLLENYTRYPRVRNREVLGFKYNDNYKDWFLTEATVEKFEINDLQVFNAAGRLRVVLKSLIPGITNFWLFKEYYY